MTNFKIQPETTDDAPALSQLSADAFGPGRFSRSAYRVREGVPPVPALSLTGWLDGRLIGGVRFTAVRIGADEGAVLLGPLLVDPQVRGKGYGKALVSEGLVLARKEGFGLVLLVGDVPYYGQFGFSVVPPGQIVMPGPVDPARLLVAEITPGALQGVAGQIKAHAPG